MPQIFLYTKLRYSCMSFFVFQSPIQSILMTLVLKCLVATKHLYLRQRIIFDCICEYSSFWCFPAKKYQKIPLKLRDAECSE